MNVRFAEDSVRFRISKRELGRLLEGQSISMAPKHAIIPLIFEIVPQRDVTVCLGLQWSRETLRLIVGVDFLAILNVENPPKSGIESMVESHDRTQSMKCFLEVDLMDRVKRRLG